MKRQRYAVLMIGIFLLLSVLFTFAMDYSEPESVKDVPGADKGLVFENMGRKTLESASIEYDIPYEDLIAELGLPDDIDPGTQVSDLPFKENPGNIVKEAIVSIKSGQVQEQMEPSD